MPPRRNGRPRICHTEGAALVNALILLAVASIVRPFYCCSCIHPAPPLGGPSGAKARTGLNIDVVALEGFGLSATLAGARVIVKLTGTADMEAVSALRRSFDQLRVATETRQTSQIEVDFRELVFISSSCITVILQFVTTTSGVRPLCPVQFTVDPNRTWQRRALIPVQRFAPKVLSIVDL